MTVTFKHIIISVRRAKRIFPHGNYATGALGQNRLSALNKLPKIEEVNVVRTQLIKARKEAGLRQWQIAETVGIDRSFYSRIERGTRNPSLEVALKIAEVLNKDVTEIFLSSDVSKSNTPQSKAG